MPSESIPLVLLPRELNDRFGRSPSYRQLYNQVLDGKLPAQQEGARWFVSRGDIEKIAETLGLQQPKAQRGRRTAQAAA
jgi:hypothetical protein